MPDKFITLENLTLFKTRLDGELDDKQDVIDNLSEIINGAAAGATAVQPQDLSFTYSEAFNITVSITNGHLANGQRIPAFVEDGIEYTINFESDTGYVVPAMDSEISVTGATFAYTRVSDTLGQIVYTPNGDVIITCACDAVQE